MNCSSAAPYSRRAYNSVKLPGRKQSRLSEMVANGCFTSPRGFLTQGSFRKLKLHSDRGEGSVQVTNPLLPPLPNNLIETYTAEEISEYRQVFNMFDTDRSGAIAVDELDAAIRNLGLEQTRDELDKIIDEVDQRGNHQIDFDEFCIVMRRLYMKKSNWHEVVKECFTVFDRSESGVISKKDFQYILRELGDITETQIIEEIFSEADVDGNGLIDFDEFSYMVKNYMTDDDIN